MASIQLQLARAMTESFRQQLAASGLQETASLLKAAVITLKSLSGEVSTAAETPRGGIFGRNEEAAGYSPANSGREYQTSWATDDDEMGMGLPLGDCCVSLRIVLRPGLRKAKYCR